MKETKIEKGGGGNLMNGLLVSQICLLTIYAPIELTRVIVAWGLNVQFMSELVFMWLLYGLSIFTISVIIRRYLKKK